MVMKLRILGNTSAENKGLECTIASLTIT